MATPTAPRPRRCPPFARHCVLLLDHTPPAAFAEAAAGGVDVGVAVTDGRLNATFTGED